MSQARILLTVEALVIFVSSIIAFILLNGNWLLALIFFAIDAFMIGYLLNPKIGATIYNLAHLYIWPVFFVAIGYLLSNSVLIQIGVIWLAHVSFDRLIQAGLKYPTKFKDTHMGHL